MFFVAFNGQEDLCRGRKSKCVYFACRSIILEATGYTKLIRQVSLLDSNYQLPYSLIRCGFTIGDWDQPVLKLTPNDLDNNRVTVSNSVFVQVTKLSKIVLIKENACDLSYHHEFK